jgi:hypothetical protein
MANVTAERSTNRDGVESLLPLVINAPMAASTKIFKGAMVALSTVTATKGQAVKAGATTTQQVIGMALATVDNSAGRGLGAVDRHPLRHVRSPQQLVERCDRYPARRSALLHGR